MRVFQNFFMNKSYEAQFRASVASSGTFHEQKCAFLNDRFGASHILLPVLESSPEAFFTNGNFAPMQRAWARDAGMPRRASLEEVMLAQIEDHRAEVFYNFDPYSFDGSFARRLPSCVRKKIAWRAAPGKIDFNGYDLVVNNFDGIRRIYEESGIRTAPFYPAHDPVMDEYAENSDRQIDVLFVGGYSRHHVKRRSLIERLAALSGTFSVALHLDTSRFSWIAQSPIGLLPPLSSLRVPSSIRKIASGPVFGRHMYERLSQAKIVVNAAIDLAGPDRGNMRCFEAMGSRALLLSDEGNYPPGMANNRTMLTYQDLDDLVSKVKWALSSPRCQTISDAGYLDVRHRYSKERQYEDLLKLCE